VTADNPATCDIAGGHLSRLRAIALALRGRYSGARSTFVQSAIGALLRLTISGGLQTGQGLEVI